MNGRHPNEPGHDDDTGEIDEAVVGELLDPVTTGVLATLHRVEIDQQIATAKAYPRNVPKLRQELAALVTMDEDTADDCVYALPRGNKHIKGPSARFADALISFWGNARSGAFITQVNKDEKFVEAIGSFQDVERNVIRQRRVRRPIVTARGQIYNTDMINMTGNAACVIAERNAILNGIPKSLWSGPYEQAFALVAGTTKTLGEKLDRATKAFALQGITMDQVLEKLGYADLGRLVPDDIVTMRGMITALKTGEETIETMFGRGGGPRHETEQNPLKDTPRGSAAAMSQADRVVSTDGRVLKDRDGADQVRETIADSRADNVRRATSVDSGGQIADRTGGNGGNSPKTTTEESSGSASNSGEKIDTAAKAAAEPAGEGSEDRAQQRGHVGNNAQGATTGPATGQEPAGAPVEPYDMTADSYMAYMRDCFDTAKSKASVTEFWGATRADRNSLLSDDQVEELTKDKEAVLKKLKLKEPK